MSPDALTRMLQGFLAEARDAVVCESGEQLFDLAAARFSLSDDHGRCVLHLWSEERNIVRRVLDAEIEHDVLTLSVQRFGQAKPAKLEICRDRDRRTPSERKRARNAYQALLRRVLERNLPGWTVDRLSSATDLERSFGPIYTRGLVRCNNSAFAVLGVSAAETQVSIDAALTFGILWLDECRRQFRGLVEGVKLFLPSGSTAVTRAPQPPRWRRRPLPPLRTRRARYGARGGECLRPGQCCQPPGAVSRPGGGAAPLRCLHRARAGLRSRMRYRGPLFLRDRLPPGRPGIRPRSAQPRGRVLPQLRAARLRGGRLRDGAHAR